MVNVTVSYTLKSEDPSELNLPASLELDDVLSSTPFNQLARMIREKTGLYFPSLDLATKKAEICFVVTDGENEFEGDGGAMKVNLDTTLLQAHHHHLRSISDPQANHSRTPGIISHLHNDTITLGDVVITPERTIRVPSEGEKLSELPPSLGGFPLKSVDTTDIRLPKSVREAGGSMMPMYQNEAMWLNLTSRPGNAHYALKIHVGHVNALTGVPRYSEKELKVQDWVTEDQPWLDGVALTPNVVRQFVAVPIDSDLSVEKQLTGQDTGGIRFDIFPHMSSDGVKFTEHGEGSELSTPRELGLQIGDRVKVELTAPVNAFGCRLETLRPYCTDGRLHLVFTRAVATVASFMGSIFVQTLTGTTITVEVDGNETIHTLKEKIQDREGIPLDQQRLLFRGRQLQDQQTLHDCDIGDGAHVKLVLRLLGGGVKTRPEMSIGAGGKIKQKIYEDARDPREYDEVGASVHLHVFNSSDWKTYTGRDAPPTPVSPAVYEEHGLPYYHLYDEHVPALRRSKRRKINPLDDLVPVPDKAPSSLASEQKIVGLQLQDVHARGVLPPQRISKKEE